MIEKFFKTGNSMKDLVMTIIIIAIKIFHEKSLFQLLKYYNKVVVTSEFCDDFSPSLQVPGLLNEAASQRCIQTLRYSIGGNKNFENSPLLKEQARLKSRIHT